ncbi:hypothetical protein PR003_g26280 [Phytophthora rubi]|uniref:Uncharacterized protein n=1 Tax=Phytophthora rubi TaxID=129364 RepID=A0A6A4CB12_9STRA|nr:hypothetical protein PR003_g26280 [Phytophthora rubi]
MGGFGAGLLLSFKTIRIFGAGFDGSEVCNSAIGYQTAAERRIRGKQHTRSVYSGGAVPG